MFLKAVVIGPKEGTDLIAGNCEKADSWLPGKNLITGNGTKSLLVSTMACFAEDLHSYCCARSIAYRNLERLLFHYSQ